VTRIVLATVLALGLLLLPSTAPGPAGPGHAFAASPDVSAPPGGGGDPRSVGEGPGLVGDPLFAVALVLGIGLLATGLTALYVRATGGRRTRPPTGPPSRPR
jgi:hypothetical protein